MVEPARPYTPRTLADRWACTPQHVRDLIRAGELHAFRVGRMIRIRQMEVERFERGEACGSSYTEASGASTGGRANNRVASLSERRIERRLNGASATGRTTSSEPDR